MGSFGTAGTASAAPVSRGRAAVSGPEEATLERVRFLRLPTQAERLWVRSVALLFAMAAGTLTVPPHLAWQGRGLVVAASLAVSGATWLVWVWRRTTGNLRAGRIILVGLVAGLVLSLVHPNGTALAFAAIPCLWAGYALPRPRSLQITLAACLVYVVVGVPAGFGWPVLIGPGACLAALMGGLIRRQNEALEEETRLAREEQARSAALAERARIAREIHDVLAHSLAALTVQLETADALLEGGRAEQARQSVVRAGQLAREGLAETRRAIGALRGETLPLPDLLETLAAGYRNDFGAPAVVRVEGQPCELAADTSLALYRTAQEAMTNVRKHAPGASVRLDLRYAPREVSLGVGNEAPPDGTPRPLATVGGGYGLTGLRERAQLAGGTFDAGPAGDGYRVDVRIPV